MAEPDVVDLPDEEAVRHFRAKRNRRDWNWSFDWRDVSAEEHLTQFTFAKAAQLDVLEAVRGEVDRAIAQGTTLRQFVDTLKPRLQKLGWWGEKEMVDPRTGETRRVQIGPRRLRTIFDTNLRMAHARGRWERIQALKEDMPYLRYVSVLDARTRPDHARWHGVVLPVDDPWWASHYPPNGWRCRCQVVQLSEGEMRRRGWAETPRPRGGTRKWTNKRTGEILDVPEGIDPGFQRNVGLIDRVAAAQRVLEGKIAAAAPAVQRAAAKALREDPVAFAAAGREVRQAAEAASAPAARSPAAFLGELRGRLRETRGAGARVLDWADAAGPPALRRLVEQASRELPASWVLAGNAHGAARVGAAVDVAFGLYEREAKRMLLPSGAMIGNAVHEYVHHLQQAMPAFQRVFLAEHLRRTTDAAGRRRPLKGEGSVKYREGKYVDPYFGRDYGGPDGDGLEVASTAMEFLFGAAVRPARLKILARYDPLLLDLVIGALFRFDP